MCVAWSKNVERKKLLVRARVESSDAEGCADGPRGSSLAGSFVLSGHTHCSCPRSDQQPSPPVLAQLNDGSAKNSWHWKKRPEFKLIREHTPSEDSKNRIDQAFDTLVHGIGDTGHAQDLTISSG